MTGIRVVDLTTVVFGPYATQTLADYGADVIKVEAPGGDSTRVTGPCLEPGMASLFLGANRNKRSVVLDLKTDVGRSALRELVRTADIFVHNILPQKCEQLGITPTQLCAGQPALIHVSLLGFGSTGSYAGQPAYDDIIQALSGAVDLCHRHTGQVRYMPTIAADKTAAQMAVHAMLAALFQRERTGRGQVIEVPMFECMVQFLMTEHFFERHLAPDDAGPPQAAALGYPRTLDPCRKPYRTADGYACLMPYSDRHWRDFFGAIGRPELALDPRFASLAQRTKHIGTLLAIVETETIKRTTAHWLATARRLEVPCAAVNRLEDLEADPHLRDVRLFGSMDSGGGWTFRFVRQPVAMGASSVVPHMPPRLGEHTAEILADIGFTTDADPTAAVAIAC